MTIVCMDVELSDHSARIADRHHIGRDDLSHYRAGTDGHIIPDRYSRQDSDASSDPDIVSDGDRFRPLVTRVPFDRISAVACRIYAYIRPDKKSSPMVTFASSSDIGSKRLNVFPSLSITSSNIAAGLTHMPRSPYMA